MLLRLYAWSVQILLYLLGDRRSVEEAEGFRVVVHRIGPRDGEPWLLLHGLGSTAFSWISVIRALRKECRLVIPELSVIGGTRGPDPALSPRNASRVLVSILEREGGDRAVTVAGISLGAWIALRFAIDAPDRVARLLLVNAAGWANQDWDLIQEQLDLKTLTDVDRFYRLLFQDVPWRFRVSRPGILKAFRSPSVRFFFEHLNEDDLLQPETLSEVTPPTGIVWADDDGLFSVDVAWEMAKALPDLRYFSIVPDSGHAIHWDRPDLLVERVLEFRRRVPVE